MTELPRLFDLNASTDYAKRTETYETYQDHCFRMVSNIIAGRLTLVLRDPNPRLISCNGSSELFIKEHVHEKYTPLKPTLIL